ncbi:rac GTPase-activating protein 1-like [Ornithodoros turicata]|uniref:rac GTPase-activating protein 1-like n=1 Tax=Ornithodoros turicata TaxID=34597 RepID=UPI003139FB16
MSSLKQPLSVVAQFDDFCRLSRKDFDVTTDFLSFVKNQDAHRKQLGTQQRRIDELQHENEQLRNTVCELETELEYTRCIVEEEKKRSERCEKELQAKTRQVQLIKEFILNTNLDYRNNKDDNAAYVLGHLNERQNRHHQQRDIRDQSVGSVLSPSLGTDNGTDKFSVQSGTSSPGGLHSYGQGRWPSTATEQNCGTAHSPGGSAMQGNISSHSCSDSQCSPGVIATTTVTISEDRRIQATSRVEATNAVPSQGKHIASNSVYPLPPVTEALHTGDTGGGDNGNNNEGFEKSDTDDDPEDAAGFEVEVAKLTASKRSTPIFMEGGPKSDKLHSFIAKTAIKPDNCKVCGKRIRFYKPALRCPVCRLACHPECKANAPKICVPVAANPSRNNIQLRLADFASPTSPMVPELLTACLAEVERRGLEEDDLYISADQQKHSEKLLEQFLQRRRVPALVSVEIPVICSMIRGFLNSLNETLIPGSLWEDVVCAAGMHDASDQLQKVRHAISKLPQPSQDTLALLISRLQGVVSNSKLEYMVDCLARTFGPVIVGSSSVQRGPDEQDIQKEKQILVMKCLLTLPSEYWSAFLVQGAQGGVQNLEGTAAAGAQSRNPRGVMSSFGFLSRRRLSPLAE